MKAGAYESLCILISYEMKIGINFSGDNLNGHPF